MHNRVKLCTLEILNLLDVVESQVEILQLLQPTDILWDNEERDWSHSETPCSMEN